MSPREQGPLPAPTRELARLTTDLDAYGYCIVGRALEPGLLAAVRERLLAQAAAEHRFGVRDRNPAHADPTNQWVNMLLNKGDVFHELALHPIARALATHVLGPDHLLSCCDAQVLHPGGGTMSFHTDQWWMPAPVAPDAGYPRVSAARRDQGTAVEPRAAEGPIAPPAVLDVMWMITDFTDGNGATRIVPRSHLSGAQPAPRLPATVETVAVTGPAGTAFAFDGRTWHAAGANASDGSRYGITVVYCGPQFRLLENYTRGLRPEVLARASPELVRLLGFSPWSSYGHTGDPLAACAAAGDAVTGELERQADS